MLVWYAPKYCSACGAELQTEETDRFGIYEGKRLLRLKCPNSEGFSFHGSWIQREDEAEGWEDE